MTAALLVAGLVVGAATAVAVALSAVRRTLEARLSATHSEIRRLGDAATWQDRGTDELRRQMASFRGALDELGTREQERRAREDESWRVLHRVASVLSGGRRTGRVGENVLRESLAHLPPSMIVTDFRVNGRVVEFGLVLPDGRRMPIDSKWPADRELQELAATTDPVERERLERIVERTVADRAKEVAGYRDPALTGPIAVAAVPDAAYVLLRRAHADAYRQGVIVIPYSMALPVVLFLYSLASRLGSVSDVEACLGDLAAALDAMEATVENKVARASTMLANGTEELRGQMGKARNVVARAREGGALDRAGRDARSIPPAEGGDGDEEDARIGGPRLVGLAP